MSDGSLVTAAIFFLEAVVELLESLLVKLRIAPYARCGAGEKQHGLRAMVGASRLRDGMGIMGIFMRI